MAGTTDGLERREGDPEPCSTPHLSIRVRHQVYSYVVNDGFGPEGRFLANALLFTKIVKETGDSNIGTSQRAS